MPKSQTNYDRRQIHKKSEQLGEPGCGPAVVTLRAGTTALLLSLTPNHLTPAKRQLAIRPCCIRCVIVLHRGRSMAVVIVTRAADYVGATCTSTRIALHASAIPHQPGIAELAAQLALEVVHPRRAGFGPSCASRFSPRKPVLGSAVSWGSRRSRGGRLGRRRVIAVKLRRYAAPGGRFLDHQDTRR
jgi:hypothetical protein